MKIAFFGIHSQHWLSNLNENNLREITETTIVKHIHCYPVYTSHLKTYDLVIPLMETHALKLNKNDITFLIPSNKTINKFMCKFNFELYVRESNLTLYVPKTFISYDEFVYYNSDSNLFIIKPYFGVNGSNMLIVKSLDVSSFNQNIVQEHIPNNEQYVSHIFAIDGIIKKCITYKYSHDKEIHINQYPVNTGNISNYFVNAEIIEIFEQFLKPELYTGICNIDFIIVNEKPIIFEINPRLGGSLVRNKNDLIEMLIFIIEKIEKKL
jgi:glutathione synthase/RimK-type ligase-like ATP-grasp enzyme